MLLSVVIPCYKDVYLPKTILSLLENSENEIEIIAVLDGWWPTSNVVNDPRVRYVHLGKNRGMRGAINAGIDVSRGNYLMKTDSHCHFAKGFDTVLIKNSKPKRIQVPTRKRLDAEKWEIIKDGRDDINYLYLDSEFRGRLWNRINRRNPGEEQIVAFQGSCYFMERPFWRKLDILDDTNFGGMGHESQEVTFKCWLAGGEVIRNKNTWYAHWHRTWGKGHDRSKSRTCLKRWISHRGRFKVIKEYNDKYGKRTF